MSSLKSNGKAIDAVAFFAGLARTEREVAEIKAAQGLSADDERKAFLKSWNERNPVKAEAGK